MIHVPANSRETFTVCGIDPGTHNLGLGVLHVDIQSLRLRSYEAYTLVATKLMDDEDLLVANHGHTYARTNAHREALVRAFQHFQPSSIGCEDAFFNRRTPGAYEPLLKSIMSIRQAALDYNPYALFTLIEASVIKSAAGAVGWSKRDGTHKTAVRDALLRNAEFCAASTPTPILALSEHAVDSLAIAYTRLKQIR